MLATVKTEQYVYHKNSLIAPTATFLEDIYDSIHDYVDFLLEKHFNVLITREPEIVIRQYRTLGNSSLYSFDTKMDNVPPAIHGRSTHLGATAGPATICSMTNDGEENQIEFCAALSEHDDIEEANTTFNILRSNGQKILKIHKAHDGNFDKFEELVKLYTDNFLVNFRPKIMEQYFTSIQKSYGDISKHDDDFPILATLMGYPGEDAVVWAEIHKSGSTSSGEDIKDRIEALRYIKEGLMSALGPKNTADQTDWMYAKRNQLNGLSAWQLLETGKIDDMRAVAALVNKVIG